MTRISALLLVLCLTVSCGGASSEPKAASTPHKAVGIVKAVDVEKKRVKLDHEKIEGLMDAMTMWFLVHDGAILQGLAPEDRVAFTVVEEDDGYFITEIAKK